MSQRIGHVVCVSATLACCAAGVAVHVLLASDPHVIVRGVALLLLHLVFSVPLVDLRPDARWIQWVEVTPLVQLLAADVVVAVASPAVPFSLWELFATCFWTTACTCGLAVKMTVDFRNFDEDGPVAEALLWTVVCGGGALLHMDQLCYPATYVGLLVQKFLDVVAMKPEYRRRERAFAAAQTGNRAELERIVQQPHSALSPNAAKLADTVLDSAMRVAAMNGRVECVQFLLGAGARVNRPHRLMPVFSAAKADEPECVRLLLSAKAHTDTDRWNLLPFAVHHGAGVDVVAQVLAAARSAPSWIVQIALWHAANHQTPQVVRLLLEAKASVDHDYIVRRAATNATPDRAAVLQLLMDAKADLSGIQPHRGPRADDLAPARTA
jgi:hypothetical protein